VSVLRSHWCHRIVQNIETWLGVVWHQAFPLRKLFDKLGCAFANLTTDTAYTLQQLEHKCHMVLTNSQHAHGLEESVTHTPQTRPMQVQDTVNFKSKL
jgi:hypothetical protein